MANKICPSCGEGFGRLKKGGYCPHCRAKLELVREKKGAMQVLKYKLINEAPTIKQEEPKDPDIIIDNANILIKKIEDRHWLVLYKLLPQNGVCPNCKFVLFKRPRFLEGGFQDKCDRCKHIIDFEFRILSRQKFT